MKSNPCLNVALAAAYIVGIVFVIQAFTSFKGFQQTLYIPIGILGLLVLSVVVMSFFFGWESFRLYFNGEKAKALAFFGRTVGVFAIIVAAYLVFVFSVFLS